MKLTLCNTPFDRENDNVLLFDSKAQLINYFNNLSDKSDPFTDFNFDVKDLIKTTIYIDVVNNGVATLSLFKLLNYNYCFIESDDTIPEHYYYFIERSYQDNGNRIRLDLTLDAWNTYIYDIMGPQKPLQGMIQKTHLDRFIQTGADDYTYNFQETSPLFERETIKDVSKKVSIQRKLKSIIDSSNDNSILNNWLSENIQCWLYVYLSGNVEYSYLNIAGLEPQQPTRTTGMLGNMIYKNSEQSSQNDISSNFVVLCAPIYKTNNKLYTRCYENSQTTYADEQITVNTLFTFIAQQQGGFANVKSIKFSLMPPMNVKNYIQGEYTQGDYFIQGNNLYLSVLNTSGDNTKNKNMYLREIVGTIPLTIDPLYNSCFKLLFFDISQKLKMVSADNLSMTKWNYPKNSIKTLTTLEPKLNNEDYSIYRLLIGGQQYELPISKTSAKPSFIYKEILTPDITKGILIFDTNSTPFNSKVFENTTEKDFTGFTFTVDLSMWYPNSALDNYLANNKNYLQIFKNEKTEQVAKGIVGTVAGFLSGNELATFAGGISGINQIITTVFDKAKLNLTIDNMRNSPQETSAINSNALLIQAVSGIDIIIEKLEPLFFEREIIIDNLKMFGYTYNKIGNIYNFVKTRKYYNYIQSIIFDIDAPISEAVKDLIKANFNRGIRIWHGNNIQSIDFNVNNYERYLDNE